jgi:hypothetical protein
MRNFRKRRKEKILALETAGGTLVSLAKHSDELVNISQRLD